MKDCNGILVLDKEEGMTSQVAVSRVRRLFGAAKAGHSGTLDPMATGVLPVMLGRAVKASADMLGSDKHYIATLRLGLTTDTEDVSGTVLTEYTGTLPDAKTVSQAAASLRGELLQIPPMYSALKRNGQKLCDLARAGITVEREARPITVHRLEVTPLDGREYRLEVVCSKGTYIRTLCADLGALLGCGGVMSRLRRAEAAGYTLAEAHTLGELEGMSEEARLSLLHPIESVYKTLPALTLPPFFARLAHCGAQVYLHKLGAQLPVGTRVRLLDDVGFFAVGTVSEYEDGLAVKPQTQFRLE